MWKATFINTHGVWFSGSEGEPGIPDIREYISYCTERGSLLVSLKRV